MKAHGDIVILASLEDSNATHIEQALIRMHLPTSRVERGSMAWAARENAACIVLCHSSADLSSSERRVWRDIDRLPHTIGVLTQLCPLDRDFRFRPVHLLFDWTAQPLHPDWMRFLERIDELLDEQGQLVELFFRLHVANMPPDKRREMQEVLRQYGISLD